MANSNRNPDLSPAMVLLRSEPAVLPGGPPFCSRKRKLRWIKSFMDHERELLGYTRHIVFSTVEIRTAALLKKNHEAALEKNGGEEWNFMFVATNPDLAWIAKQNGLRVVVARNHPYYKA
ncbi:OLC1v1004194C1 [Oldenlandia corymbosa var. corymbosa]|uniref:OLC1v1004194C1 n=1 Tax=Oldenlandia corymbosa var. corymbosa TaxID=529605 RepID=A0AAV1DCY7_OLDCO|nr:OLC1v1004194C1 [Oldenlandia corymbosa var. corymbosa]